MVGATNASMKRSSDPIWKTIVCLANSRKLSGRCVAGIEIHNGRRIGWVRPVSDREHQEVSECEQRYSDGSDPIILDVIDVPMLEPQPRSYQSENWLLDPSIYWVKVGRRFEWDQLGAFEDREPLWLDGTTSTYNGLNDRVSIEAASSIPDSLRLIHVADLKLRVFVPSQGYENTKRRVQAVFTHLGTQYRLAVTDPVIERKYFAGEDGNYVLGDAYLTVSLGEPYDGYAYKLVAAVIVQPR